MTKSKKYKTLDKTFLIICLFIAYFGYGQIKPGGTSLEVELWLKADNLSLIDSSEVDIWTDVSGKNRDAKKYTTNTSPIFYFDGMNYNPRINFGGTADTKLAGDTYFIDSSKSYFVFTVSEISPLISNTNRFATFSFTGSSTNGSTGVVGTNSWIRNNSYVNAATANSKKYVVSTAFFPNKVNTPAGSSVSELFTNGIRLSIGSANNALSTSVNDRFTIGAQQIGNDLHFIGDINEVIVLSVPNGTLLNLTEVQKVNSHLALKYGITLDIASQANYYDSDNAIIWNGATNAGYQNDIFGLGRDDASDWYQKQSASYENTSVSVFLNELTYTNSANTGTISADKSFLLLGSNGLNGDSVYEHPVSTSYNNGSLPTKVNKLYNKIFKAQKTGAIASVNMFFRDEMYAVQYVLVSTSAVFTPGNTRFYPVVNGRAFGIVINNGDYVGFSAFRATFSDPTFTTELWLDASEIQQADSTRVNIWYDKSGNFRNFYKNGINEVPLSYKIGMNFNGKLTLADADRLIGNQMIDNNKEYYVFHVSELASGSANSTVFSLNSNQDDSYGWRGTSPNATPWVYDRANHTLATIGNKQYAVSGAFTPNINDATSANSGAMFVNGARLNYRSQVIQAIATQPNIGVSNLNSNAFIGDLSEILVISANKTGTANTDLVQKVNSYLALKYGISLDPASQANYFDSNNTVIWNGTTKSGYQNQIFGIGRDDNFGLYQKQATNYDYNSITVYLNSLQDTNNDNAAVIQNDRNFIILGSNALTGAQAYIQAANTTYANNVSLTEVISERYNRTLKVSNVGSIGPVNIRLSNELLDVPYILVSSTNTFSPTTTRLYPVIGGIANNVTLNDDDFVTFVLIRKTPGGASLDVELWLKADALSLANSTAVNIWYDQSLYSRNFSKNLTDPVPTYNLSGMNFNPTLNFGTLNSTKLANSNFVQTDKAYYVFYVSEVATPGGYQTVYSLRQNLNGSSGWSDNPTVAWMRDSGNRRAVSTDKKYGVNMTYFPNRTVLNSAIYTNGIRNLGPASTSLAATNTNLTIIGTEDASNGFKFTGGISEIIVLSIPNTSSPIIQEDQILKVNSYLALKYGITMKSFTDSATTSNYIASDGTTVIWNSTADVAFNNDIFGVGRDDLSALYQKQGTSYDNSVITAYVGSLEDLNTNNTGVISTDRTFLLFGSNNQKGYTPYIHEVNDQFDGSVLADRLNNKNRFTLKAKNTNSFGLVNLLVTLPASYVIVSPDPLFPAATTRLHKITNRIATNVQINDGDYVSFATYAIGPGGVVDALQLWLVADSDNIDLNGGANVAVWKDLSPAENDYSYDIVNLRGKSYPQFLDCSPLMNFKPTIQFSNTAYLGIFGNANNPAPMSRNTPDEFTSFTVYHAQSFASNDRLYTHGFGGVAPTSSATRYPAMGFAPGVGVGRLRNEGTGQTNVDGNVRGFYTGATAMQMISTKRAVTSGTGYAIHDFGGFQDQVTATGLFGNGFRLASGGIIGGSSLANASFNGLMSEVFFFERALTDSEQDAIRSYLGTKYAITIRTNPNPLAPTGAYDYKLSDGTIVWYGTNATNTNYHHNIAGLARDDSANLNVKMARSTAAGAIVTMSVPDAIACDPSTNIPGLPRDYSGLYWGNNNVAFSSSVSYTNDPDVCGAIDNRLDRIWLVEKSNLPNQTVTIKASGSDFPYNGGGYEVFLLIADNAADFANKNWDQIIPGSYIDGEHQFAYTFKNEYTYFTFAAKTAVGNCESCEFSGTKKLDFRRPNWVNGSLGPRTYDLDDDFKVTIAVTDVSPATLRNGYPRRGSANTLRFDRGRTTNNAAIVTNISFTDDASNPVSASTTFEIYNIDRSGGRTYDNVIIKGYCSSVVVVPKITYMDRRPERSSYNTITLGSQAQGLAKMQNVRYSGGVGYTNTRGRMLVHFDSPVERIEISYAIDGLANGSTKRIGIGPMQFSCIKNVPLPPPNDDGLIFTKQGTEELLLCETVDYIFGLVNTNCAPMPVNLTDELPVGMEWVPNSVVINSTTVTEGDIIYDNRNLTINNIEVPGGGSSYLVRAQARFITSATAGPYNNTGTIDYEVASIPKTLSSKDRFTNLSNTVTTALNSNRPNAVNAVLTAEVGCFNLNQTIKFKLTINNTNTSSLSDVSINFGFEESSFTLVPSSVVPTGITLTTPTADELLMYEGLTIPAGTSTIEFSLTSAASLASYEIDALTTNPFDEIVFFDLFIDSADVCVANLSSSGDFILPYCTYCTQPPINPVGKIITGTKIGISLLPIDNQQFEEWPRSVPNGFLALNAGKRGLVLTRTTPAAIGASNWVEGMIIYNTDPNFNCISLYNGTAWKCIERKCNN